MEVLYFYENDDEMSRILFLLPSLTPNFMILIKNNQILIPLVSSGISVFEISFGVFLSFSSLLDDSESILRSKPGNELPSNGTCIVVELLLEIVLL